MHPHKTYVHKCSKPTHVHTYSHKHMCAQVHMQASTYTYTQAKLVAAIFKVMSTLDSACSPHRYSKLVQTNPNETGLVSPGGLALQLPH